MRRATHLAFYVIFGASMLMTACDGGRRVESQDGGPSDVRPTPLPDTHPTPLPDASVPDVGIDGSRCVVAVRVDECCQAASPRRLREVDADPCLVLWPIAYPIAPACRAKWDPQCALDFCAAEEPPSRVAEESAGQCHFADECAIPADCSLAIDQRGCCSCERAYPRSLIELDTCLSQPPAYDYPASCLHDDCTTVLCEECARPVGAFCMPGDAYSTCMEIWPD